MIQTKKQNKYISCVLFVLGYIVNVAGVVAFVWATTVRNSLEYKLADELLDSDIAEFFNVSSELSVNVKTVDTVFYVGLVALVLGVIIAVIAAIVLASAKKQPTPTRVKRPENTVTYNNGQNLGNYGFGGKVYADSNNSGRVNSDDTGSYANRLYSETDYTHVSTDLYTTEMVCVSGEYLGFRFPINNNEKIVLGSNPQIANIVLNENNEISAYHCSVRFDFFNNCYLVSDYSLSGTFFANGRRLPQNAVVRICRGETILLGNGFNSFRLE